MVVGIRLTTARYFTPAGKSIQGEGIMPDIIVEQGKFESDDFKRISESDLKNSLDKEDNNNNTDEINPKEERIKNDFQLARALDLIKGVNVYKDTLAK